MAHLSDGSTVDVTRLAQFEANQTELASVSPAGRVTARGLPGSVAIMARYQTHVGVLRVTVPLGAPVANLLSTRNFIDELVFKQLKELGLPPSALCDDATFLRRATIDLAGRLPTKEETRRYLEDTDAKKSGMLVDRLLASGDHADYFANKWSAVLRNRRPSEKDDPKPTAAFHAWIRESLDKNKPYDKFVREILTEVDPREKLVDWMTAKDNPYFAPALVNRYWKHFLGRGLVDPEDDLRVTNPASNPALLDALAKHFAAHNYDLKDLVRTICTSQVYRLSAEPNAYNARDTQNFSRFLPRRLPAEVLLDAIDTVTGSKTTFKGVPATTRAVQLPDNQFESYFLSAFGRPDSASACECERSGDASLAQALHLINSEELMEKISGRKASDPKKKKPAASSGPIGGRMKELLADKRPDQEKIDDLYLIALSRKPTQAEADTMLAHIKKKGDSQAAYEDLFWVLINTKEFLFNH